MTDTLLEHNLAGWVWSGDYVRGAGVLQWVANSGFKSRRALCEALALRAVWEAELGNAHRASTALQRGFEIARLSAPTGTMSAAGQLGCEKILLAALEQSIDRCRWDDLSLRRLSYILPRDPRRLLEEAVVVERVAYVGLMELEPGTLMARLGSTPGERGMADVLKFGRGLAARLQALDYFGALVNASRLPVRAGLEAARSARANMDAWRRHPLRRLTSVLDLEYRIDLAVRARSDVIFAPNFDRISALEVAIAAIGVERWRRANEERLPVSWEDLVPEYLPAVPRDPADDQPLRYATSEGGGYRIHACGSDLSDDGGLPSGSIEATCRAGRDLVWSINR